MLGEEFTVEEVSMAEEAANEEGVLEYIGDSYNLAEANANQAVSNY